MGKRIRPPRQEFERRFLVDAERLPKRLLPPIEIVQGYLSIAPAQVRVRIRSVPKGRGALAEVQIKGRDDFESDPMALPVEQARFLLERLRLPGSFLIRKRRHVLMAGWGGLEWEIDVFEDENHGLVIAELEVPSKRHPIPKDKRPPWLGREITGETRFKNKELALHPFLSWPEEERREVVENLEP